jgi:acyl-coenzyme A synthetase/AMP-(fatty) acid ligase
VSDHLPLLSPADGARPIALHDDRQVSVGEFLRDVAAIAQRLPPGAAMIDLCEDRYHFLAAYAAALSVGHPVLLPPSRAGQVIAEVGSANPGSYRCDDAMVVAALRGSGSTAVSTRVPGEQIAMIGVTSGSTGRPKTYPKSWRAVCGSTAQNVHVIRDRLRLPGDATAWILATVPPQHMYGMEFSIMLPLVGGMAVHSGRPLFPADIAQALEELPAPRILVSTPVHLRALVESAQSFPAAELIVSATAPLDRQLAVAVERKLRGELLEIFGSTETCVIARRDTAHEHAWNLHEGVRLDPRDDGTLVDAPWYAEPILLQDLVELLDAGRFVVRGRNSDMIEVAGKRASLTDLTRRLLAIEGVRDAVVFQPDEESVATIRRVAALVVAPDMDASEIRARLAASIDPAFLPRPLVMIDALPRNEVGKLPREMLLQALKR